MYDDELNNKHRIIYEEDQTTGVIAEEGIYDEIKYKRKTLNETKNETNSAKRRF